MKLLVFKTCRLAMSSIDIQMSYACYKYYGDTRVLKWSVVIQQSQKFKLSPVVPEAGLQCLL